MTPAGAVPSRSAVIDGAAPPDAGPAAMHGTTRSGGGDWYTCARSGRGREGETKVQTIDLIAGARPNFVKLAPVFRAVRAEGRLRPRIVHTGQHYDASMDAVFFSELGIPSPDVHLEVGSGSHGAQTARILERYETHLLGGAPAAVVVFGDVNSTVACALAAVKLGVRVAHVEAGLRCFDRSMPEEINRLMTDAIADLLLVSEPSGVSHLRREGIPEEKIRLVGNVMVDSLRAELEAARGAGAAAAYGLEEGGYGLVTLHRPSNVDDAGTLARLLDLLEELGRRLPLVFPVHPRTRASAERHGLVGRLGAEGGGGGLTCVAPLPYRANLGLMAGARVVLTDSGGIQEETTVLGVPCLTLRENTERPITVEMGTSRLVGNDEARIRAGFEDALAGRWRAGQAIPLWDGQAGPRVARELADWLTRG
jgi:UDP-N-acetylglucosamine 2-epimerase (non-hydrolysing)